MYKQSKDSPMQIMTKAALIATVANRYRDAYLRRSGWLQPTDGSDPVAIHARLSTLSPNATEAEVLAITGDPRWTANICDECHQDSPVTVLLAEEIHHPTDTVTLCTTCLQQAATLATAH
jgi:hypothetical protein